VAEPAESALAAECAAFARYLTGERPSEYVVTKYLAGHPALLAGAEPIDPVDRLLVGVAIRGPAAARIADAYARHARPTGLLRRKLVLALAIFESSPPTHTWVNGAARGPAPLVLLRLAANALLSAAALGAGVLLLGPMHLVLRLGRRVRTV